MAITRKSRSIELTAAGDAINEPMHIKEIWWYGTGLTAGQEVLLLEEPNGSILARRLAANPAENECVRLNCCLSRGLYVSGFPAAGVGKIIVYLE